MMMFFLAGPGFWVIIIGAITLSLMVLSYWGFFIFRKVMNFMIEELNQPESKEEE